uniref:Uncharacterized protein n=1 Tax=Tanacetum cinerariifolium TaxID=118510 RepID=A0A699HN25_TANCI|nr:hypothetical protein [Tanacetum cinerariifolium]
MRSIITGKILAMILLLLVLTNLNPYSINHPIFNAHNDYLDSQITLNSTLAKLTEQMTSFTSFCEMACQIFQKKQEEKQLEEERAAKAQNWKLPVCFDDDDDEERSDSLEDNIISGLPPCSAITPNEPVLSTEDPDNSINMGDEHLDTILTMESDEVIKSSVENLIPIPSESEGIPEHMCDVPFHDNSPPLDVLKDQIEDFSKSNEEFSSTDEDSFSIDKIDYVEASPPDSELVSSEVMEIVIPEVEPNSRDFTKDVVEDISPTKEPQVHNALPTHPTLQLNLKFQPSSEYLFTYVVWNFLTFLVYSVSPDYLLSLRNEDTIFDPGICNSPFFRPDVSHRFGTFPRFKVLPESPMEIFSSTCSPMDQ